MRPFELYFTDDLIIQYLCKLRVQLAKKRSRKHLIHLLTNSDKYNYHSKNNKTKKNSVLNNLIRYELEFTSTLSQLLPPRRKWVKLGSESRINKKTSQTLSSNDRNYQSLLKTIKSFKKKGLVNEPWLVNLSKFIDDIKNSISSDTYKILSPIIYPKLKNEIDLKGPNKCRPISLFSLKDRVILSLTNRFLTGLFDGYFQDCSYAFRKKKNKLGTSRITHHDCINDILEYRKNNRDRNLWVVECDIEKFYDSVNHRIIKKQFNYLIKKAKKDYPLLDLTNAKRVFEEFLKCYSFNTNVLLLNEDDSYWSSYKLKNGSFEWVGEKLLSLGHYKTLKGRTRIGIPQGGALSGLIANIVLNTADRMVIKTGVHYVRFCDDMLIIHNDREICRIAKENYTQTLNKLKLIYHDFKISDNIDEMFSKINTLGKIDLSSFWNGKSKGPYKWASISDQGFPWIGFVGYEMHHEGYLRVRKRSLFKEIQKQKDIIEEIRSAIKYNVRKSANSILQSTIHRLVGMSVGRITLRNFKVSSNDLCWKNGFKALTMNKYSIQQMKILDRHRNKYYYTFTKELKDLKVDSTKKIESRSRQIIHFNKPFSYYYQILERDTVEQEKQP